MPDNTVEIKVIADVSSVPPAFNTATQAASAFVQSVNSGIPVVNALDLALVASGQQLDLFAIQEADAAGQFSLFSEAGAAVVPVMEEVATSTATATTALAEVPTILSSVIDWFKRTGTSALEMATEIKTSALESSEGIAKFAERTRVSATGIQSSFSLIGGVLGEIAIVGILAEGLDKIKEMAMEVSHLSEATGLSAVKIVELQDAMADVGSKLPDQSISRLVKAMEAAKEGAEKQKQAFKELGVNTEDWGGKLPPIDDVLQKFAIHLKDSTNNVQDMAALQILAGRNVIGLTAGLKAQGSELEKNMEFHLAHGEAIERAIPSAKMLVEIESRLSAEFKTIAADVLPSVVIALKILETAFTLVMIPIRAMVNVVLGWGTAMYETMAGGATAWVQIAQGKYKEAAETLKTHWSNAKDALAFYNNEIYANTKESWDKIHNIWKPLKPPPEPTGDTNTDAPVKFDNTALKIQEKKLEGEKQHQVAILELKKHGYENEERLGQIAGDENLARILKVNDEILAVELDFNTKMAALAVKDPKGGEHVQEIANQRIAATDKAASQEQSIREKYAQEELTTAKLLEKTQKELAIDLMEWNKKSIKQRNDEFIKGLSVEDAAWKKATKDQEKAIQEQITGEERHFKAKEDLYRKDVEFQASLGIISAAQKEALLLQSSERETAFQRASIQKQIDNLAVYDDQYLAKRQALMNQLQAIEDQAAQRRQQAENQHLQTISNNYKALINDMGTAFQNGIMSWVNGTKTFGAAFAQMGQQMVSGWISTLLQMGVKWAEHQALKLVLNLLGITQQESAEAEAALTGTAIHGAATAAQIPQAAALAAANAYAATAAIPFIGPELAPAVAAQAFATVMSFEGLAAFEQGGIVSNDQLAMVHKNEMVLPAPISQGMQSLIQGGSANNPPSGDTHFHFNPTVSAVDAAGVSGMLEKHQREFIRNIQKWNRTGHLSSSN